MKKILTISVLLIMVIGLIIGIWLVQQRQQYKSKASSDMITLSFIPAELNLNLNQRSGVGVQVIAGTHKIIGIDLEIQYGGEVEAIEFVSESGNFDTPLIPNSSQSGIDLANKTVRYSAINKGTTAKDQMFLLGSFKFFTVATGSGQITFRKVQIITESGTSGFSVNKDSVANYTIPASYDCTASYTLNPIHPVPNNTVTVDVSAINTPNYSCVVLYQDNQPVSCRIKEGAGVGKYICTASSGGAGNHTLQLKFGQASRYPASYQCGQAVECDPLIYQTTP